MAAQLRLRLSYASYKTANNVSTVPFATLEQRLAIAPPPLKSEIVLEEPVKIAGTKRPLSDPELMPPPPAPSLYTSLLDIDSRPAKRQRKNSGEASTSARALGPSPGNFKEYTSRPPQTISPSKLTKSHRDRPSSSTKRKPGSSKKPTPTHREILAMTDKESVNAAKTLASLLVAKGSPNSPEKNTDEYLLGKLKRPASMSSIELGDEDASKDPSGSPSNMSAAERDSAELLLLLATSPSPARPPTKRPPSGIGLLEPRILFSDTGRPSKNHSGSHTLLPAPPSPVRKNNTGDNNYSFDPSTPGTSGNGLFSIPPLNFGKPSGRPSNSALGGPFTPAGASVFPAGPPTGGTTPFNMSDYLNFTPTPGAAFSPAGRLFGGPIPLGMTTPTGMGLLRGTPSGSVNRGNMLPARKTDTAEKKKKAKTPASTSGTQPLPNKETHIPGTVSNDVPLNPPAAPSIVAPPIAAPSTSAPSTSAPSTSAPSNVASPLPAAPPSNNENPASKSPSTNP